MREEIEKQDDAPPPMYPGHIPTTALQKTLLAAGSAFVSMFDPTRGRKLIDFRKFYIIYSLILRIELID